MATPSSKLGLFVAMFTVTSIILIVAGVPLAMRRVAPNGLYGVRVPATFANERVWYDANAASGRDLIIAGAATLIAALLLPFFKGMSPTRYSLLWTAIMVGALLVVAVAGIKRSSRLLHEYQANPTRTG